MTYRDPDDHDDGKPWRRAPELRQRRLARAHCHQLFVLNHAPSGLCRPCSRPRREGPNQAADYRDGAGSFPIGYQVAAADVDFAAYAAVSIWWYWASNCSSCSFLGKQMDTIAAPTRMATVPAK